LEPVRALPKLRICWLSKKDPLHYLGRHNVAESPTALFAEEGIKSLTTSNQRLHTAMTPTLLEPDLLAGTNIVALPPPVVFQGLVLGTIRAKPQRTAFPLAVGFGNRDRHTGDTLHSLA
jgi:hypothetical protein